MLNRRTAKLGNCSIVVLGGLGAWVLLGPKTGQRELVQAFEAAGRKPSGSAQLVARQLIPTSDGEI